MDEPLKLLGAGDPAPFQVHRPQGTSPFILIADHAGQSIPARLGDLGVAQAERDRHIGWDIGIAGVTERLSEMLEAFAILPAYSRVGIDCGRPLEADGAMVAGSDGTPGSPHPAPPQRRHACARQPGR